MPRVLARLKNSYIDFFGFHTKRKLLVIESDDWGSIRMPSRATLEHLQSVGDFPMSDPFLRNDCLENEQDIMALLDVLSSVSDGRGRNAVLTANYAVANPDFDHICPQDAKYVYEPFFRTYQKYYPQQNVLSCALEGFRSGCFFPQLHCREHMNVNRWMRDLVAGKADTVLAFKNQMIGVGASFSPENRFGYMDAFNGAFSCSYELDAIINDAAALFKEAFGYVSKSFVPSCFVWDKRLEKSLLAQGVCGIQSGAFQYIPRDETTYRRRIHYTGERNKADQIYTVRNCLYEPAYGRPVDECVESCFFEICRAFKRGKPAIINSHRLNYVSSIDPDNAKRNLSGLRILLRKVKDFFPEVEFVNSEELLMIIKERIG